MNIEQVRITLHNQTTGAQEELVFPYDTANVPKIIKGTLDRIAQREWVRLAPKEWGRKRWEYSLTPEKALKLFIQYELEGKRQARHTFTEEEQIKLAMMALDYVQAPRGSKDELIEELYQEWRQFETPKRKLMKRLYPYKRQLDLGKINGDAFEARKVDLEENARDAFKREMQQRAKPFQTARRKKTQRDIALLKLEGKKLLDEIELYRKLQDGLKRLGIVFRDWERPLSENPENRGT